MNTTTNHTPGQATPGPWTVGPDSTPWTCGDAETAVAHNEPFGHTEILTPITDGDEVIAYVPWEPLAGVRRQAELRQRTRLIAGAPEMLDALEAIIGMAEIDMDDLNLALDALSTIRGTARELLARIDGTTEVGT